jgi:uncharacterized protein
MQLLRLIIERQGVIMDKSKEHQTDIEIQIDKETTKTVKAAKGNQPAQPKEPAHTKEALRHYAGMLARELHIQPSQAANTIHLLADDCTVPFIARYRKEATDGLDETQIVAIRDRLEQLVALDKRRETILKSIEEQGKLTAELQQKIVKAKTLAELEDMYLPYRPKKRTRGLIAKEKGLENLAFLLLKQTSSNLQELATPFISAEKDVKTVDEALAGARDIIADIVNENADVRAKQRYLFSQEATLHSRVVKNKETAGAKYRDYFDFEEPISKAPSHRLLAIFRAAEEGIINFHILPDEKRALSLIEEQFIKGAGQATEQVRLAIRDSYKRLLSSSLETEIRNEYKTRADATAIKVFTDNLRELLLASPLGQKTVLAVDPGLRTGCKVVCLDRQGSLLHNTTIYPLEPHNKVTEAMDTLKKLCEKYKIEAIAIGNGTGGRETDAFCKTIDFGRTLPVVMVNESGASVYSASPVAREEFPDYDVTVRGAVSIGRRLMDPLAELVKIDPKSIGVGQYQHDVDQKQLKKGLDDIVESCVNQVGVEVNTASKQLLRYVSGFSETIAGNFIQYRREKGPFRSRDQFLKVKGMGPKTFLQAAGFLRIQDAPNPLDASAVHPESYHLVEKMAVDAQCTVADLMQTKEKRKLIKLKNYVTGTVGLPTLTDIMHELEKPGRDPREPFELFSYAEGINDIDDLHQGMELPGVITNVTAFGAFVDIGVHQDGLVHISELADTFVSNPHDVVKVHQKVTVTVLGVDYERRRISLSMKQKRQ